MRDIKTREEIELNLEALKGLQNGCSVFQTMYLNGYRNALNWVLNNSPIEQLEGLLVGMETSNYIKQENKEDSNITITCPHCNTVYTCKPGGNSLHCYDYKTIDGKQITGILETKMLQCPTCKKEFKDED